MTLGKRIKLIRGDVSRDKLAPRLNVSKNTLVNYETDIRTPDAVFLNKLLDLFSEINPTWLLTGAGEMKRVAAGGHVANGNGILQGHHVNAEEIHIDVHAAGHAADPGQEYMPPRCNSWLHDWIDEELKGKSISEVMSFAVKFKQLLDLDKNEGKW